MANSKYLVVVHPPKSPRPSAGMGTGAYTVADPPTVQHVTASSAEKAAEMASVRPGGHCLVAEESDVRRFDRAEQAPLEERYPSGERLPQAMPA